MNKSVKLTALWMSTVLLLSGLLIFCDHASIFGDISMDALNGFAPIPLIPVVAIALLLGHLLFYSLKEARHRYNRKPNTWLLLGFNTLTTIAVAYVYYVVITVALVVIFLDTVGVVDSDPSQMEHAYTASRFVQNSALFVMGILLMNELWLIYQLIKKAA